MANIVTLRMVRLANPMGYTFLHAADVSAVDCLSVSRWSASTNGRVDTVPTYITGTSASKQKYGQAMCLDILCAHCSF